MLNTTRGNSLLSSISGIIIDTFLTTAKTSSSTDLENNYVVSFKENEENDALAS